MSDGSIREVAAFSALRTLLASEPPEEHWPAICDWFDSVPDERLDIAVDYAVSHINEWDVELDFPKIWTRRALHSAACQPPSHWMDALLSGEVHPKWRLIRTLNLSARGRTSAAFKPLARCETLDNVHFLDISENALSKTTLEAFETAPVLQNLHYLNLSKIWSHGNPRVEKALGRWLVQPHLRSLRMLEVSQQSLVRLVASKRMEEHFQLTHLSVADGYFERQTLRRLAQAPHLSSLVCFVLSDVQLQKEALHAFLSMVGFSSLRELYLDRIRVMEETCLLHIAENEHFQNLELLSLSGTGLHPSLIQSFLEKGHLPHLRVLRERYLDPRSKGVDELRACAEERGISLQLRPTEPEVAYPQLPGGSIS
jgi:hypothetical protein